MERGGKAEVQTCSRDDTCQPNPLHKSFTPSSPKPDVRDKTLTSAANSQRVIWAFSSALNVGVRVMDGLWCVEYDITGEGHFRVVELRGIDAGHEVLKYSVTPLNQK
jgi:hypothetical protein